MYWFRAEKLLRLAYRMLRRPKFRCFSGGLQSTVLLILIFLTCQLLTNLPVLSWQGLKGPQTFLSWKQSSINNLHNYDSIGVVKTCPLKRTVHYSFFNASSKGCKVNVTLPVFNHRHSEKFQLFFLETSGRPYLKGRQACSVESAAISSCLISKVILKSSYLDLSKSRSLCDLYYSYPNVEFYSIDFAELFR